MSLAFLGTIAAQMGAAWLNSCRMKNHNEKMSKLQQAYEEKVTHDGIENARIEFAELCAFQREIDAEMQRDRISQIQKNYEDSIILDAYAMSLSNWPLLVPPCVISNTPIVLGVTEHQTIPLTCILTASVDINFNIGILPKLEENLAVFCTKYWNKSSFKSIRFLQNVWRDNYKDVSSRHKDIYAHLKDIPMLLISPIIKNDTLLFRYYWWGISTNPSDAHINDVNELNLGLSVPIAKGIKFTTEIIETIVAECTPKLEAFISFFADQYYWNFYKKSPELPLLIKGEAIKLIESDYSSYKEQYTHQLTEYTKTDICMFEPSEHIAQLVESVSHIADRYDISDCIKEYIHRKRTNLNYFDLDSFQKIQCIPSIQDDLVNEIETIITTIKNKSVGYILCAGKNDLFQILNKKKKSIPNVSYAIIAPIVDHCSIICFCDKAGKNLIDLYGYRTYIAIHPAYSIQDAVCLSLETFKIFVYDGMAEDFINEVKASIHLSDINNLYLSQKSFIDALRYSYQNLKTELWNEDLELIDIEYDNLRSIIECIYPKLGAPEICYVIIGYSDSLDNYTISISLSAEDSYVGERFVCRSNSLDNIIRNKLNNKKILKIRLK